MDLVASYDSDEVSDIDGHRESRMISSKNVTIKAEKCYDVIDLESDTDNVTSTDSNSIPYPSPEECIDIPKESKMLTKDNVMSIKKENSKDSSELLNKKHGYLNLESSEDEEDVPLAKFSSIMNTASVLNEIPCGPVKPLEVSNNSTKCDFTNRSVATIIPSSSNESNLNKGDTDQPDKKRIKITDEAPKEISDLFKEDERVIEANQKNVVCRIPKKIVQTHPAHSNVVMSLNWCIPQYSHLFLSASLDGSLKVWDLYHSKPVQQINVGSGLSAAKWSLDGGQVVFGGVSKKAYVFDVQTGKRIIEYNIYNSINSMEVHPYMEDVFLCGTKNAIMGFDIRVNTTFPIRSFFSNCKEVLDIVFLDENEFVCSSGVVSHDSDNRTIMVWDFSSGVLLSNQIYSERYTCPSLKVHPLDSTFVAQSNGNYIAVFSTTRPYKIKNKRYKGHSVAGYSIECDISSDGKYLVSGDAYGHLYFYNYSNTAVVLNPLIKENCPTNRIKWHPAFPSILISASYDGHLQIWK